MKFKLPSLRALEAFVRAAETLSFREAAGQMNITESAVSHRIRNLEDELGHSLFYRDGRKISLTRIGMEYHQRMLPLLEEISRATDAIPSASGGEILRIAGFQGFISAWLTPRLNSFLDHHRGCDIEILTLRRRRLIEPDVAITSVHSDDGETDAEKLFDWDSTPLCSPELLRKYNIRKPEDLRRTQLISPADSPHTWPAWLAAAGINPHEGFSLLKVDSAASILSLMTNGVGVALISHFMSEHYENAGLVRPFPMMCVRYSGGVLVNRPAKFERPIVKAFRDWLREEASLTNARKQCVGETLPAGAWTM